MELWEKQHAYIPRRFVVIKVIMVIEPDRSDHFDHPPSWQGPLGPRFCQGVAELGDGRHREPRQASAVTQPFTAAPK
jgi:hypothetical protein